MKPSGWVLLMVLVATGAFVAATGQGMPDRVASHFAASGRADGFQTREGYVGFMLGLMAFLAALFGGLPKVLRHFPPALVNLPNRDYWLAPERREATWEAMERWMRWFGCALLVFMAYVHFLVVIANESQPAVLPEGAFIAGLIGFGIAVVAWLAAFYVRFRRPGQG